MRTGLLGFLGPVRKLVLFYHNGQHGFKVLARRDFILHFRELRKMFLTLFICFLQGGLVFITGTTDGLMSIQGRKHNAEDIKATVLAVDPVKHVHRGRIAVFSVSVLREDRIVIVVEQKSNCSEEKSFQWVLDSTRERLARHYLSSSTLSATEISFLLGYENPSSFYRAFQTWTGETPDQVRRSCYSGPN